MKIVIDMNLSPDWVKVLTDAGWESVHWSTVGDMRATDDVIMSWARDNGYIVYTRFGFWHFAGVDTGGKPERDSSPHAGSVP